MKIISTIFFTVALLYSQISVCQVNFERDSSILRQLEYDWLMAEFRLDTATISAMMDDSFISIGEASISTKQEELEGMYKNISERKKKKHVVDSLILNDVKIRIYGKTAIVTFISVTSGRINEVPFSNRRNRIYDVWVKRHKQWKAVASHIKPIGNFKN